MTSIRIHAEVADALAGRRPVVALETAVIAAGLPREPLPATSRLKIPGWNAAGPANLELGRAMERSIRTGGGVPATVAVMDGVLRIGLDDHDLVRLASDSAAGKASITDLAHCLSGNSDRSFGTTVSATLAACSIAGIRVFATGGIGGVHRNWQRLPDISADLRAIASNPVCVVCAGAKSILDLPATLEALESLGVPVLGFRTNVFPQFQCTGDASLKVSRRVEDAGSAAEACRMHWETLRLAMGLLLANPVPAEHAMGRAELDAAVEAAERAASDRGIAGAGRTPFLLSEIARLTHGRSLDANIALLLANASLAAQLAAALAAAR
jgi:pseudouridylate synthase